MAALSGPGFSVVTTLAVSVPVIAANVAGYGFAGTCDGVQASGLSVLAVERGADGTVARLRAAIADTAARNRSASVVLGCAGMAPPIDRLRRTPGPKPVDGIASAALLAEALVKADRPAP